MHDRMQDVVRSAAPRELREDARPNAEQDVEPMFPEPWVEIDVDELE